MKELIIFLQNEGYSLIKEVKGHGLCGIRRMAFTTGLFCGLNEDTYNYRYCFPRHMDAVESLNSWDGVGHPPGNWIKRKSGKGPDISNPNYEDERQNISDWIYLDPDYNKQPPAFKIFCCRCKEPIPDKNEAVRVETKGKWPLPLIRKSPSGTEFVDMNCWKIITETE